jgi:hypothetical protein
MTTMRTGSFWQRPYKRHDATTPSAKDTTPAEAHAELILHAVAGHISGSIPRHAQLAALRKLGFEILNPDPNGRVVSLARRTFVEGHLESLVAEASDNAWEALGRGRPLGTKRQRAN